MPAMQVDLDGKTAVITGGSSGIGLAAARLFLECGANVAICGRDENRLKQAAGSLDDVAGDRLMALRCDVLSSEDTVNFADAVKQRFGATDMLVNNAGQGRVSTFADTSDAAWHEEFTLKNFGVIYPTRAFLPMLEQSDSAAIVCMNSLLAVQPEPHMVATSAARAGLLNLVHSMAAEFASRNIRVNSILLGLIESGQWQRRYEDSKSPGQSFEDWAGDVARDKSIPLGRFGRAEEAARAILFLASPASSYTTGAALDLSGGLARHAG